MVQRKGTASLRMTEMENYRFNKAIATDAKRHSFCRTGCARLHIFDAANGVKDQSKGLLHSHAINDFDISDRNRFGTYGNIFFNYAEKVLFSEKTQSPQ